MMFHLLMHVGKLLQDRLREQFSEHGLHHGQGRVLDALMRNGELSQIEIAKGLHIQRPTVTTMIQRMEAAGLIEWVQDDADRRVLRVRVTPKGEAAAKTIREIWESVDQDIENNLPADKQGVAQELLLQIRNHLGGQNPDI